jgi:signal transduction histidine kinase
LVVDIVDLTDVVRSAVEVAQGLPKAPPIRVKVGAGVVTVRGDAGRLEQVFLNLLANAMEHAPGSKTIDVTIVSSDGWAEVAVRDRGPGVSADGIGTMFDPYTRLGDPQQTPGLGLGLYVAREIITAHQGEIEARSRVGKGTVMTVRLPVAERRSPSKRVRGRRAG